MSDAFRDRMLEATKVVRGQERELKRRIAGLYARCAQDMEKEILHYGEDTLTGRRAAALQKAMRGYVKGLWKEVHRTAEEAVQQGAALGIEAQASLLDDAVRGIRLSIRPSFKSMFARTQDEAVAAVLNGSIYSGPQASLSRRIWNNEALQGGQIERLIAEATARGRSATELARDLEAYVNPKAAMPDNWNDVYEQCPFPFRVDYNAKRLAVASLNHSYYQGMLMAARENPYAEYLHWELSSMHLIYDVCDTYMEHDEGLGLGNFSLDNAPLPHPFCRCLYYVDSSKSLSEIGDEIGRWISGEENARLDGAFGEWKALAFPQNGATIKATESAWQQEVRQRLLSGEIPTQIHKGRQGKHILGNNNYTPGKSYLFGTLGDAQALIDQYHGTGVLKAIGESNRWNGREVITADHDIGININPTTGEEQATNRGTIHYAKGGAHIVPAQRK